MGAGRYVRDIWDVIRTASEDFMNDNVPRLGAAIAYYSMFSIAPLALIAIAIVSFFFGDEAGRTEVLREMRGLIGQQGAVAVAELVEHSSQGNQGVLATIFGIVALLFGASGVFVALQDALNTIWEVEPQEGRSFWAIIRDRLLSASMVVCIGFLLLVSLIVSAILSALSAYSSRFLPLPGWTMQVLDWSITLLVVTLLFAAVFRILPDAHVAWRDVWVGAVITALLFTLGKWGIGLYLGNAAISSSYGAAGTLVVLLVWTYYSAQILLFGGELTQAYARKYGSEIVPLPYARKVSHEKRARQGISREKSKPEPVCADEK